MIGFSVFLLTYHFWKIRFNEILTLEIQLEVAEPATLFLMGSGLSVVGLLLRKMMIKPIVK